MLKHKSIFRCFKNFNSSLRFAFYHPGNVNCKPLIISTCDIWDFVKYCREEGIKPITGAEVRNEGQLLYILISANNKGLLWINEFLSQHFQEDKPFPILALEESFFTDTWDGFVIYPSNTHASKNKFVKKAHPLQRTLHTFALPATARSQPKGKVKRVQSPTL